MDLNFNLDRDQLYLCKLAACGIGMVISYFWLSSKNTRLANWLAFIALGAFISYFIPWDYVFNEYFRIRWKLT